MIKEKIKKWFPWSENVYYNVTAVWRYVYAVNSCKKANRTNVKYDKKSIEKIKNSHLGERCFIIGSGPSLQIEDVEKLKNEWTFGVNADYTLYEKCRWRADFYAIVDDSCLQKYQSYIDNNELKYFFYGTWSKYIGNKGVCIPVHNADNHMIFTIWNKLFPKIFPAAQFSSDISKVVFTGKSVVYALLQIATYMGFKEIYLLGVDCNYSRNMYCKDIKHEDNFTQKRKIENGYMMLQQYDVAQKWAERHGVKIYNATRGGMLEVFPRVEFDKLFEENRRI